MMGRLKSRLMRGKIFVDSIEKVGTQASVLFPALKSSAPQANPAAPTGAQQPASNADKPAGNPQK